MVLYGVAHRIGDGVTAAQISAPEHASGDPADLASTCLLAVDARIGEAARPGDILLAGAGLGAGAGAEQAVLALQAAGFGAIVCASAAAGFVEIAELYGLPVLICPEAARAIAEGGVVRIDLAGGTIAARAGGATYTAAPSTPALLAAVRRAQLLSRMRQVVEEEGFDG